MKMYSTFAVLVCVRGFGTSQITIEEELRVSCRISKFSLVGRTYIYFQAHYPIGDTRLINPHLYNPSFTKFYPLLYCGSDVEAWLRIPAPANCGYVTLNYVWGRFQTARLKKS
jgi:hypothetical protein